MSKQTKKTGDNTKAKTGNQDATISKLRTWNKWLAMLYALQGVAILLLGTAKTVPLTINHLAENPLATEAAGETVWSLATRTVADINIAYVVAAFLFIAAVAHASAAWWCRTRYYEPDLARGVNRLRWYTFQAVGSLMLVTVALLAGVSSLALLVAIIVFCVAAGLSGLALEGAVKEKLKPALVRMLKWSGGVSFVVPWAIVALYLGAAALYDAGQAPVYAYLTAAVAFVLMSGVVYGFKWQLSGRGKWKDYLYGERQLALLSFAAASVLAWQVYLSVLAA